MVYLLQEEMRLFGPASTIFPLQMAYKAQKVSSPLVVGKPYSEIYFSQMESSGPECHHIPYMAYKVYKSLGSGHQVDIAYIEGIVDELHKKGLKSAT
jgi:hypothetical protein